MNKLLPLLCHRSKTNKRVAVQKVEACFSLDAHKRRDEHRLLLPTSCCCRVIPFHWHQHQHQQQHQMRYIATNRRKQLSKSSAAGAKSSRGGDSRSPGNHNSRRGRSHRQQQQQGTMTMIRPPKNYMKKLPKPKEQRTVPPALLAPTASPYVYISQTALADDDGDYDEGVDDGNGVDDDGDGCESNELEDAAAPLDPSTLFAEAYHHDTGAPTLPPLFAKGDFRYFSPKKDLGYEYPSNGLPEIAFLGRSNVGKSSLINALMRNNLCLTSRTPGRTRLPYYYGLVPKATLVADRHQQQRQRQHHRKQKHGTTEDRIDPSAAQGFIVDLPGYGYGKAPTYVTEDWQKDTQDLLLNRRHEAKVLQRLFLLMDARRGMEGPNEHDRIVMRWLEDAEIPFTIVLTKADRVSVPLVVKQVNDFCLRFASQQQQQHDSGVAQSPVVHVTSSTRGWGIHELMISVETEFFAGNGDYEI
mmetsp:Transcript_22761/g.47719  ORF Transcript_22761/g.47719 Transcript_22761/m.47719 type:complete len:471 (-) Transcript_22761:407-1819(-)